MRTRAAALLLLVAGAGCGGDYRPPSKRSTGEAAPLGVVLDLEVSLPSVFIDTAGVRGVDLELHLEIDGIGDGEHEAQVVFEAARLFTGFPVGIRDLTSGEVLVTVIGDAWITGTMGPILVERTPFTLSLIGTIRDDGWWVIDGAALETQAGGQGTFRSWRRHRFLVASTDFLGGVGRVDEVSLVKETEIRRRTNLTSVSSDPVLRRSGAGVFVVNRLGFDNLQRLDPGEGFGTGWQQSTGMGSNPHDVILISEDRALVSRYEPPFNDLAVVDPADGLLQSTIPLGLLAGNPDGTPRPDRMAMADGTVFVGLQDIDRTFSRYGEGKLAVVDPLQLMHMGAIPLGGKNPGTIEVVAGADGRTRLYVALGGIFPGLLAQELSGGVVVVDVADRVVERMALDDDDAGGNVGALAMASETLGYVVVSDASYRNRVLAFDPVGGVILRELLSTSVFVPELEVDRRRVLALPDRSFLHPQLCLYRVPEEPAGDEEFLGCAGLALPPASLEALD